MRASFSEKCNSWIGQLEQTIRALVGLVLILVGSPVEAKLTVDSIDSVQSDTLIESIGIQGQWKLGHCCIVRLNVADEHRDKVSSAKVTTLDGDGVEVSYSQPYDSNASSVDIPVQIGRRLSVLSASLLDGNEKAIASQDRSFGELEGLPATQPMAICIGSAMGLNDLVRTHADESISSLTLIEVQSAKELPTSWVAYQACNLVVISTADIDLLKQISHVQWQAIDRWIRRGGGCIISLGGSAESLRSLSALAEFIPGEIGGDSQVDSPAALESMMLTSDQKKIQPFPGVRIENAIGQVQLSLRDKLAKQIPWWLKSSRGFGTIQVIASDLNHPSFANWKQRSVFWEKLVAPYFDKASLESSQAELTSSTSYLGYSDIVGQLRATLDWFAQVDTLGFSHISAILILILILIGPIDYLISVKWRRKPHISWMLAGLFLVAATGLLTWYYQRMRPDIVITNSAQIVDVDSQTGQADGHIWTHVYSAYARPINVEYVKGQSEAVGSVDWQGLPGKGLGGLQSQLTMERGMPAYSVEHTADGISRMNRVGIVAAGSKSLHGTFSNSIAITAKSELQELDTVDQVSGLIVNPLDVELKDVSLIYHRWYYPLKSRMPVGDRMQLSAGIIPKDLARRLNRQQEIEGKTTSAKWDPSDRANLPRLMELMMFYGAASGKNYTSLTHNYQNLIDHSNLAESDCAILVGRVESAPTDIKVAMVNTADSPEVVKGINSTWYRVLLPVEKSRRAKQSR